MDFTIIAQYLEPFILLARFDKSAFHLIEIYTMNSIIHFSNKSALEILADNRGFGKYQTQTTQFLNALFAFVAVKEP